jgi:hypothetical protein
MTTDYKAIYAVYDAECDSVLSSFVISEFGSQSTDWNTKSERARNAAEKCKKEWLRTEINRRLNVCKIIRNPNGGFSLAN